MNFEINSDSSEDRGPFGEEESVDLIHALPSQARFECVCDLIVQNLRQYLSSSSMGYLFFVLLLLASLIFATVAFMSQSIFLVATALSLCFAISFFFFISRIYHQARMPEMLGGLRDEFIASSRQMLQYRDGYRLHHSLLAHMLTLLDPKVQGLEYAIWQLPKQHFLAPKLNPFLAQISAQLTWSALHAFRQLILLASIDEYIKQVQCDPVNLHSHASLAKGYVRLSALFNDPRKKEGADYFILKEGETSVMPWNHSFSKFAPRFKLCALRAIEEFKIIAQFAPEDVWVHRQLALCYCDLKMQSEEIQEYEVVTGLCPTDDKARFRLGVLYFKQGRNADGLRIYRHLLENQYPKVHQLLSFYEAYRTARTLDPFEE